jgi:ribose transport system permease protein
VTWLLPANLILFVALSITQTRFFAELNFEALLSSLGITLAISLGQMVVIASGGMNLALGSIGALGGLASCYAMIHSGLPLVLDFALGLLVGMVCGAFNGFLVGQFGLSAFIVTLGSSGIFTATALGLTNVQPLEGVPESFIHIGAGSVAGVPILFVLAALAAVLVAALMRYTNFGRQVLALGGNGDAAQLVGIRRRRVLIGVHVLSGVLAAWAGILTMAQLGQGQPDIGSDWLLTSFAAPIIGGTLFAGGYLSVAGTCLGACLLTLVSSGVVFMRMNPDWVELLSGLVVVSAAVLERARLSRSVGMPRIARLFGSWGRRASAPGA